MNMINSTTNTPVAGNTDDTEYAAYIDRMNLRLNGFIGTGEPLFFTDATLWPIYLDSFGNERERQYHNCSACRHFMQRYGALATIDENGGVMPALWHPDDAPVGYLHMAQRLYAEVVLAEITGVFIPASQILGDHGSGQWRHYAATVPASAVWNGTTKTAGQAMAEKREDFKNVSRALGEFKPEIVAVALSLLDTDALYRSEKVHDPVKWLANLHSIRDRATNRRNVTWRAIAKAPAGFCHPRSSMAGTLLEDLANGVDLEAAQGKFKAKMHPLRYQRPQAAPSQGAIDRAEKLVEQMGIARSLERRFALVEECELLWSPPEVTHGDPGGVFAHLRKGSEPTGVADGGAITWERFADKVLSGAASMQIEVPYRGSFFALVTAVHEDAPPILQWDNADQRNPVSWYTHHGGGTAQTFGLSQGSAKVLGVVVNPAQWFGSMPHHDSNAVFLIDGARAQSTDGGLALFPEILKSELREVRSVIEAHSRSMSIQPTDGQNAAGLSAKGSTVLVTDKSGVTIRYTIDRWV